MFPTEVPFPSAAPCPGKIPLRRCLLYGLAGAMGVSAVLPGPALAEEEPPAAVVRPATAGDAEHLAAEEIRRYVYLRTGRLLPVVSALPEAGNWIALAVDPELGPQSYALKTTAPGQAKGLKIAGGSGLAVLYGAYAFAEKLGVRFYAFSRTLPGK